MKKKNILFIHHSPSENTKKLSKLVENKIKYITPNVNLKILNLIEANTSSLKEIDGLIIGTIENFGYMSGLTKDFFDRCYNDLKGKTEGLSVIYYIRAGLDGEGCKVALNKILIDKVLSSQWCRCKDTARYAFGNFEEFSALNSTFQSPYSKNESKQLEEIEIFVKNF